MQTCRGFAQALNAAWSQVLLALHRPKGRWKLAGSQLEPVKWTEFAKIIALKSSHQLVGALYFHNPRLLSSKIISPQGGVFDE
jgi:hypothetical protein